MVKLVYDVEIGNSIDNIHYKTQCNITKGVYVGSDDCVRCKYFKSLYLVGMVECLNIDNKIAIERENNKENVFQAF